MLACDRLVSTACSQFGYSVKFRDNGSRAAYGASPRVIQDGFSLGNGTVCTRRVEAGSSLEPGGLDSASPRGCGRAGIAGARGPALAARHITRISGSGKPLKPLA